MEPNLSDIEPINFTTLPQLGAAVPRRGNRLSRAFWSLVLRLMGWRVVGEAPDLPRFVFVGAPHTSNQDFFMTALTMAALGIDVHFVMKHTPFVGPVGWFLRWFGGIPLDRHRTRDFVAQMVEEFGRRDQFQPPARQAHRARPERRQRQKRQKPGRQRAQSEIHDLLDQAPPSLR